MTSCTQTTSVPRGLLCKDYSHILRVSHLAIHRTTTRSLTSSSVRDRRSSGRQSPGWLLGQEIFRIRMRRAIIARWLRWLNYRLGNNGHYLNGLLPFPCWDGPTTLANVQSRLYGTTRMGCVTRSFQKRWLFEIPINLGLVTSPGAAVRSKRNSSPGTGERR